MIALDANPLTLEICEMVSDVKEQIYVRFMGKDSLSEALQFSTVEEPNMNDNSLCVFMLKPDLDLVEGHVRDWLSGDIEGGPCVAIAWPSAPN